LTLVKLGDDPEPHQDQSETLSIASKSPLREIARRQNPKSAAAARQFAEA